MNERHVLNELSAYIDGECGNAEAVERHLRDCCQCAQRLVELRQMSALLQSVPAPELRPEFVTRVVGRAAETPVGRTVSPPFWARGLTTPATLFRRFALPLSLAGAVAFAVILVAAFVGRPQVADPSANGYAKSLMANLNTSFTGDDAEADASPDLLLAGVADSPWLGQLSQKLDEDGDLDAIINTLDNAEAQSLKQLLEQYKTEGTVI